MAELNYKILQIRCIPKENVITSQGCIARHHCLQNILLNIKYSQICARLVHNVIEIPHIYIIKYFFFTNYVLRQRACRRVFRSTAFLIRVRARMVRGVMVVGPLYKPLVVYRKPDKQINICVGIC